MSNTIVAQKQNFDVVSFSIPKGWQEKIFDGGVQYSITDKKTGGYAIALITKSTATDADSKENFTTHWNKFVKATVQVNAEPAMLNPINDNGWEIISGTAKFTDGDQNGVATLLTATDGGLMTSVLLMTNTSKYQQDLLSFINSLKLSKALQSQNSNSRQPSKIETNKTSIVGLWVDYLLETTGYYINNQPQYTAGYLRKEYAFYADGTYQFRNKQWLTKASDITFVYETGTYQVSGNQLTLSPKTGKGGFWEKTPSTKEWGKLKKNYDYKLEKTTYSFEIKYFDDSDSYRIDLKTGKPTQRDGGKFNVPNDPYEFHYNFRKLESLIDNPPGF